MTSCVSNYTQLAELFETVGSRCKSYMVYWKFVETHGNSWQCVKSPTNSGKRIKTHGNSCKFVQIRSKSWKLLKSGGNGSRCQMRVELFTEMKEILPGTELQMIHNWFTNWFINWFTGICRGSCLGSNDVLGVWNVHFVFCITSLHNLPKESDTYNSISSLNTYRAFCDCFHECISINYRVNTACIIVMPIPETKHQTTGTRQGIN